VDIVGGNVLTACTRGVDACPTRGEMVVRSPGAEMSAFGTFGVGLTLCNVLPVT
jgi:hypothetical protein